MLLAMTLTAGGLAAVGLSGSAQAAVTAPINCPTALPTSSAVDGLQGTGFTVERGTKADPFNAEVLGRLKDGIAPGIDMIMAKISSPAVTRAGGSWYGISGSPVSSSDGKLIGSVSYGLAASSDIVGITPGADILKVYSAKSVASAKAAKKIAIPAATSKTVIAAGATKAQAKQGFSPLKPAMTVSGLNGAKSTKLLDKLSKKLGAPIHLGGQASGDAAAPGSIFAGSNFAAALSYGDASLAGVGTTTTVCNNKAVAFGHTFNYGGKVQDSAHAADAVLIQPDPSYGPFKLANVGGLAGTVDRDLTTGIRADLGATPSTYPIHSSISNEGDAPVEGNTVGVDQTYAGDVAAVHLQGAIIQALGSDGGGSAALTTTITGTRAGGKPFTLTLADHYSDKGWLSITAAFSIYDAVYELVNQPYEPVTITGIDIKGSVTSTYSQWRVNNVRVWKGGAWARGLSVAVKAGSSVKLRTSLSPYKSEAVTYIYSTVKVPKSAAGAQGTLRLYSGGGDSYFRSEERRVGKECRV